MILVKYCSELPYLAMFCNFLLSFKPAVSYDRCQLALILKPAGQVTCKVNFTRLFSRSSLPMLSACVLQENMLYCIQNQSNRSDIVAKQQKTNAMRILEQKKLPHRLNFYDCDEFTDAVQIAQMLGQDPEQTFKTLMCVGKSGAHYAFVMQGTAEMNLKKAASAAGEKSVQLLPVKEILAVTGYIRGGCTAIGMKKDFPVFLDETALLYDEIIVSGGRLGTQIFLSPDAFLAATNGKTADLQE